MKKLISAAFITVSLFMVSCNDDKTTSTSDERKETMKTDNAMAPADATPPASADPAANDAPFAMEAAEGGMAEVKLSELAQKNGTAAVKPTADMMVKDHSMANDELKAMAAKYNITLPTALNDMHQKKYDELSGKKGADFDKAYLDAMVMDHKTTIDKFQSEAGGGKNAEIKTWAAGKVPTLTHHLEMVNSTKNGMK